MTAPWEDYVQPVAAPASVEAGPWTDFGPQESVAAPVAPQPVAQPIVQPQQDSQYFQDLMRLENSALAGIGPQELVYPNQAPEQGGGMDIGFGHKITPEEQRTGKIYGMSYRSGMNLEQLQGVLRQDMARHTTQAREHVGPELFDKLSEAKKNLLIDYSFTGVLKQFPKFTKALIEDDFETAKKEFVRYMKKDGQMIPLGERNAYAKQVIEGLEQVKAQQQGTPPTESSVDLSPSATETSSSPSGGVSSVVKDVIKETLLAAPSIVEGLGAVGTGVLGFIPSASTGIGAAIDALMKGATLSEAMAYGGEEFEKMMEAVGYQPKLEGGKRIAEYAAMPFELAHKGIEATVVAAGGDEKDVKAWQFAFDAALAVLPQVKATLKSGKKLSVDQVAEVKEKMTGVDETVDTQLLDNVLGKLKEEPTKPLESPKATFVGNQRIVDRLIEEANNRPDGARKNNYKKAAEVVAGWETRAKDADHKTISKGKGKTRALLDKLIKEEDIREGVEGGLKDPLQAEVPPWEDFKKPVEKPVEKVIEEPTEPPPASVDPKEAARLEMKERVAKAKAERERKKSEPVIDELVAEEPVPEVEMEVGPTRAELAAEQKLVEEDLANLSKELGETADPAQKQRTAEDLAVMYNKWKTGYVEKINTADLKQTKQPKKPVSDKDLGVFEEDIKTFKSPEEAKEWADKNGIEGEVITDPLTGESFIDPSLEKLEDYTWEERPDIYERDMVELSDEMYEGGVGVGELGDTGTRSLWDIINNEQGSVSVTELRIANAKLRELKEQAKRVGKGIEELLDGMELTPESREAIFRALAELPKNEEKVRELDPINEGIFNPKGDIAYQNVKKNKKGQVRVKPAMTVDLVGRLLKANKLDPVGVAGSIMDSLEIRINRFERFGSGLKEQFYDNWMKKLAESKREFRADNAEMKADLKQFTKKEREEMSIVAHARQKNGLKMLKKMGIEEIPELLPHQEAILQKYQDKLALLRDRINYVRGNIGLKELGKIDNYFPWIHQINEMKLAKILDNGLGMNMSNFNGHSKKFRGNFFPYEKSRGKAPGMIELDIFDAYETYTKRAMREIHLNPIAALAKEASNMKVGKGKSAIKLENVNPELAKLLREWSDEILDIDPAGSGAVVKSGKFGEWAQRKINNLTVATLFGTVSTAMKQPLAMIGVFSETSLRDTLNGLAKTSRDSFLRGDSTAKKKSAVLEVRSMDLMLSEMAENISKHGLRGVVDNVSMLAAKPMQLLDAMTAEAGWNAGYGFAKRKLGLGEKEAIQWADDLVNRTQGVGVKGAVSPIQTTKITKWITLFQTFAINDFNYVARDMLGIRNPNIKKPAQVKKVLKYVAASALANALFEAVGFDAPKPSPVGKFQEVRQEGGSDQEAVAQALLELVEIVPLIGGAIKYESSALGAAGQFAQDVPEALKAAFNLVDWSNLSSAERFNNSMMIAETLGKYYGIPMTNQLKKSIKAASRTDDPFSIIIGLYVEKQKSGSMIQTPKLPSLQGTLPQL